MGREKLVRQLWEILEQQSVMITAERRIGKTTVMRIMEKSPAEGWRPIYQDLERCHSASEFASAVYREVDQFLSRKGRFARRSKEFINALGGTEIGGMLKLPEKTVLPWKEVLTHAIEDLMHENDGGPRLLFLWDEVPYMVMSIRDNEGEPTAMQVLDHLRWLRQTFSGLRMIVTGSIGLHHVIAALKEKNYANSPVNDLAQIEVPPLSEADAARLASSLIEGEGLESDDIKGTAIAIAREAGGFAFYVHHIVRCLKVQERCITPATVAEVVTSCMVDAGDPWQLLHFRERIATYYPKEESVILLLLDHLASAEAPLPINALLEMVKGASTFDDRERLVRLLSLMERDHYLARDGQGHYCYRFSLIRRWWKLNRGL